MEKVRKYLYFAMIAASAAIIVVAITAALFLNSGKADLFAKKQFERWFDREYYGHMEIREVSVRFPDQITIMAPVIFEEGTATPILSADKIRLRFNFFSLLQPNLTVLTFRTVDLNGFRAHVVEYPDGTLNIRKVFTRKHPKKRRILSIRKFRARDLKITNGEISWTPASGTAYTLNKLNLDLSKVFVAKRDFVGTINRMEFTMPEKGLTVRKGEGSLAFSSTRSDMIGLDIDTGTSQAKLSLSIDGIDIFSGISKAAISKNTTFLHVESLSVDSGDIRRLFPTSRFPDGVYRLTGDAKGTLADLEILPSTLESGDSRLTFKGELLNMLDPGKESFRLQFDKSKLSGDMLNHVVKNERYRKLFANTDGISFTGLLRGQPEQWVTELDVRSPVGNGSTSFETTRTNPGSYQATGTFTLEKIEPHRLLGIEKTRSGLNTSGSFKGNLASGVITNAHIVASVKSAYWQQQQISSGSITVDIEGKAAEISADLNGMDGADVVIAGVVDFSSPVPVYEAAGSVRRLDISRINSSQHGTTDLNGSFEIKGQHKDSAAFTINGNMEIEPSMINDVQLTERFAVAVSMTQSATTTSVELTSDAFDLFLEGNASLPQIVNGLQRGSACISKSAGLRHDTPVLPNLSPYTFAFRTAVRDLGPLQPLLKSTSLQLNGAATGNITSSGEQLSVDTEIRCNTLSQGPSFTMNGALLKAVLLCSADAVSSASLSGLVRSVTTTNSEFRNIRINSSFEKERLDAVLETDIPLYDEKLTTAFHSQRNGNLSTVTIDRFQFVNPQGVWQVPSGSTIDIASDFIRFNQVRLDKEKQSLLIDGLLSSSAPGTFRCTFSNIDLSEIKFLYFNPSLKQLAGMADATFTVSGNPGEKTSELTLHGNGITYNSLRIGAIHLNAIHAEKTLRFSFESKGNQPVSEKITDMPPTSIAGTGTIPLELNYSPFEFILSETHPLQVSIHSEDMSAKVIASLVPLFDNAEGIVPISLLVSGTIPKPDMLLSTNFDHVRVRIAPTQVIYQIDGRITGTPSGIDLGRLELSDSQGGRGSVSGTIELEKLKVISVNLVGAFRNLLLYSKKDLKDNTTFGTLSATTNNIQFHGNLSAPVIEGELNLTSASISMYRKGLTESSKYIGVDRFIRFVPRRPLPKRVDSLRVSLAATPQFHFNLLDILQIRNLRLSSNVPIRGTMIFDRIRGERIETTLSNLSLLVNKSEQQYTLYGSVDLTGGKYAFSNTYFDLDNGGQITWNNEEIRNGHMNEIYGSKQISVHDTRNGDRDNVKLLIAVSGTLENPNVRMGYYLNDDQQPYAAVNMIGKQSSHIDPNADLNVISMLFSKQWYLNPERHTSGNYNPVSSVGVSAGSGLISSQVSGLIQDIAGIESFNVNLGTSADGNLSGLELYFALLVPGTDGKIRFIGTGNTPVSKSSTTTDSYYGSSQKIEYRVNPRVYVEAYRSYGMSGSDVTYTNLQKPAENWGASISYRERFYTWQQFWNRLFGGKKQEKVMHNKD